MPTARLRLSNVCEVGLSTNRILQLLQSATEPIVCHALHTKYSIALYRYCNYERYSIALP
jgi:hypothetical protein